jgi:polyferredoxin
MAATRGLLVALLVVAAAAAVADATCRFMCPSGYAAAAVAVLLLGQPC